MDSDKPKPKKRKPLKRTASPAAASRAVATVDDVVLKEKRRRQDRVVKPELVETVHPHYSLHLHVAWDVGMVTPYLDQWKLEQLLYAHIQQLSRFTVHRQDFIKRSGGIDATESWTICSIEFHDEAVAIPASELVDYGDPFKLLESLGVNVAQRLKWPGS